MTFKQLLQLEAIDVCQIDSCRTGGVQEILSILLMSAKAGVMVCPHSGGVVSQQRPRRLSILATVLIVFRVYVNTLSICHLSTTSPCQET